MKASNIKQAWGRHWFLIAVISTLLLAALFRFYNYDARWALAADQARDAIVGREALQNLSLPELGPFSSAGNFTTGNIWYIWVTASTALFPFSILTPWMVLTASYVAIVYIMILIGKELKGEKFGILLGTLTALSPAQIEQSVNLTNPSVVAVFASLTAFFLVKYVKRGGIWSLFFFNFALASTIASHFQGVYLLTLIPIAFLLRFPTWKGISISIIGLILPFLSYLIHELTYNFFNIRGILDYALYGQYRIYVPNRWLTYIFDFSPSLVGNIFGGSKIAAYGLIALTGITVLYSLITRKVPKPLLAIVIWLLITFIALRFYRGERFDGYFIFLHSFILIILGWAFWTIVTLNKYIGVIIIVLFCTGSVITSATRIHNSTNFTAMEATHWSEILQEKYPDKSFAIYTYENASPSKSLPLVLYLDQHKKNDPSGYKIGFGTPKGKERLHHTLITENKVGYELWDINASSSAKLEKAGWVRISPEDIYSTTTQWFKK